MKFIKKINDHISPVQFNNLIKKLELAGFNISQSDSFSYDIGVSNYPLPLGFVKSNSLVKIQEDYSFNIINTNAKSIKKYHLKLEEICNSALDSDK